MATAVRNSVIEIRRFSEPENWFHIDSNNNVADLGTRGSTVEEISLESEWQRGKPWMSAERDQMPVKSLAEISLSAEERRQAAVEMKPADLQGIHLSALKDKVSERHSFSKYLLDPCKFSWERSVKIMSYVIKYVRCLKSRVIAKSEKIGKVIQGPVHISLKGEDIKRGETYFFKKCTKEVKQFVKQKDYKHCSVEKDGILFYTSRILDGQEINDIENVLYDVEPLTFCRPLVDRYSPVAYSIFGYVHQKVTNHKNAVLCL